ncbi:xylan 1,4-beta-xylosidase [Paenibacillus lautus]|uniref:beta-xylosidase family glycoside hydrolase n=1 Tax=Paenibacillus lautus TaxID=1401 RepID=UPI001BCD5418|nr:xylan 1,4-beta-xylosidase [Paenibacillus lautus]
MRLHQLAALVSSDRNGGLTEAVIGLYATGNGRESAASIDFDSFEYTGYSS